MERAANMVEVQNLGRLDLLWSNLAKVEVAVEEAEPNPLVRPRLVLVVVWQGEDVEEVPHRVQQGYLLHLEICPLHDDQVAVDVACLPSLNVEQF